MTKDVDTTFCSCQYGFVGKGFWNSVLYPGSEFFSKNPRIVVTLGPDDYELGDIGKKQRDWEMRRQAW